VNQAYNPNPEKFGKNNDVFMFNIAAECKYIPPPVPKLPTFEDYKGESIPEELWESILHFQRSGGYNGMLKSMNKLKLISKD